MGIECAQNSIGIKTVGGICGRHEWSGVPRSVELFQKCANFFGGVKAFAIEGDWNVVSCRGLGAHEFTSGGPVPFEFRALHALQVTYSV